MFGAVTFLPQFQQNVQGASATSSGLLLLPLMAGMHGTSLLYASNLQDTMAERLGTAQGAAVAGGQLTPAMLGSLPDVARSAYQAAVTSGG